LTPTLRWEPVYERVRVRADGETIVDTRAAKLLHELGHKPVYYFPDEDVRRDLLVPSDHHTHCPRKGDASYWSLPGAPNAVWYYPEPIDSATFLAGHVAFYPQHVEIQVGE
jgi:uncharacterized protein (DUF427 family)